MNEGQERFYGVDVLGIDEIVERPGLRTAADDLGSLEKSIRELGLLFPLIVNSNNVLIAGHRRLEACRRAGWQKVPVMRVEADENSLFALDVLIQENLCRRDLNAEELETLIGLKKDLLGRSRWRRSWRRLCSLFRRRPAAAPPPDIGKDGR